MKIRAISGLLLMFLFVFLVSACGRDQQDEPVPENQIRSCQVIKEITSRFTTDFFYNTAGQLYRTVKETDSTLSLNIQSDISYNTAGQIAEINVNHYGGLLRNVFSYNSRNLPDTITFTDQQPSSAIRYVFDYDAAGRIIKYSLFRLQDTISPFSVIVSYPAPFQTKEELYTRNSQGNIVLSRTTTKHYDAMKNPLADLKLYQELQFILLNNNVTAQTIVNHIDNSTATLTYAYVYNPEGYPIQRITTSGQAVDTTRWTYNCQ